MALINTVIGICLNFVQINFLFRLSKKFRDMLYEPFICKVVDVKETKIKEESVELPSSSGSRVSSLVSSGNTISFLYEDAKTLLQMMERGRRISNNGRCLGWRISKNEYSWISYSEFIERAHYFGSGLVNIGMVPGQNTCVGIYAQNSVEWLVAEHGCFNQSTVVVPLYDTLGPDACTFMINHAGTEIVICDTEAKVQSLLGRIQETPGLNHIVCVAEVSDATARLAKYNNVHLHSFKDVEKSGKFSSNPNTIPGPDDIAIVCYTSGTTGDPKGAMLSHRNIIAAVCGMIMQMGDLATDRTHTMISYLPLAHIMEQICEVMIFLNGGSVGFFNGDVAMLIDDMKVLRPTFFPAVPRLLNKLYDKAKSRINNEKMKIDLMDSFEAEKLKRKMFDPCLHKSFYESLGGRVRLVLTGAAPISEAVLNFYRLALRCGVVEVYGQTECAGPCTLNVVSDTSVGNVGPPLPCCEIKLIDVPEMGYTTDKRQGEICVKGHSVFNCYFRNPARTAEALDNEGWLQTGDIGMWTHNGTLKIIDRRKHIFKLSQGEYVAPEKIESIYLASPFISQIFVHGDSMQSYLVAVVMPDQEVVLSWCKENAKGEDWSEICKNAAVVRLIFDDMKRLGKSAGLNSLEQVKAITLHPNVLTFEGGFLTPTLKTKRAVCRKHFGREIEQMYRETNKLIDEVNHLID